VRAKPSDRYLALSYVWERIPDRGASRGLLQTTMGNVEELQGRLPDADLPRTISDAMWFCRKIGVRFLWVDRYCIVQDDEVAKEDQIRHMPYIYANAYLTIVAAAGDAHTGLLGLDSKKGPRAGGNKTHEELLLTSKWNTRAWTMQELLYSRRAVFIFEDTLTWECHCDVWQGSSGGRFKGLRGSSRNNCMNRRSPSAYGYQHSPWPDMDEYARIVMDYSSRRLTYVDDTLKAFSGITTILSKVFIGGFVCGMPTLFLDIAMLWRPPTTIRRRVLLQPTTNMNIFPSWSWLGWHFDGIPADVTLWRAAADYVEESRPSKRGQQSRRFKSPNSFRLKSMITWHLTDGSNPVPVNTDGLQYRDRRHKKSAPLPRGWSKDGSAFTHDSDKVTVFRYPVPVVDEKHTQQSPATEYIYPGNILSFRTTRGFFEVEFQNNQAPKGKENPPVAIGSVWSRSGRWIGKVTSHDSWLGIQGSNYDGDERLEFIAISSSSERKASHVFDMESFKENMDQDEVVDYINVLWIERINHICYRRGLGHIMLRAWESLAKEEVDILLG
jgi:hypothetical protein